MAEIYSLPASTSLLAEVNAVGDPHRRKDQDGTIGDRAHMERVSDHNLDEIGNTGTSSDADNIPEVHARDVDSRGPWLPGWSMERIVQTVLARCRSGAEKRLKYIIFNGRIWSASAGWAQKTYTGADQHREHAHFSFRYGSGSGTSNPENITEPWGILAAHHADLEDDMPTAAEIAKAVWDYQFTRPDGPDSHGNKTTSAGAYQAYSDMQANTAANKVITTLSPLITAGKVSVDDLVAKLAPAVAQQVIALLPGDRDDITPAELQGAIVGALKELVDRPAA